MPANFFQGLIWLCIGIMITFFSSKYRMGTLSELGPGALPFGLGIIFILLSIIFLICSWRVKEHEQRLPFGSKYKKVLLILVFLTIDTFFLESLGYLLTVFLLITIPMLIIEPKRWLSALLLGIISSLSSYVLFGVWLDVQLPHGFFHF